MIDFKYYLVSIAAIIAALVAGVVIGTALNTSHELQVQQQKLVESIQADISQLRSELEKKNESIREYERAITLLSDWVYDRRLSGRTIAIIYTSAESKKAKTAAEHIKRAGGNSLSILIETASATETTSVFDSLRDAIFSPELTGESPPAIPGVVKIEGNIAQAQEIVVFVNESLFDEGGEELAEMATEGLAPVFCVDNYDLAVKLFSFSDRKASCVVYNGDLFDGPALILSFDSRPGIYGIYERNAEPVPKAEK